MDRRSFLKFFSASVPLFACGCMKLHSTENTLEDITASKGGNVKGLGSDIKTKSVHFDSDFPDDVYCPVHDRKLLEDLLVKFRAVQSHVGYGHFNLLGMDEFIHHAKYTKKISALSKKEKDFLERIFHQDAKTLGFFGDKVFTTFTGKISKNSIVKIAGSGHYLRRGKSLDTYNRIIKDTGSALILTSGVRALAKQFHLFLEKTQLSDGNFSKASRSLAPPGYSFHGQDDFDIGKIGFGLGNFTEDFAETREFKTLCDLGYVDIRYKEKNSLGVRFEPWHIKIS